MPVTLKPATAADPAAPRVKPKRPPQPRPHLRRKVLGAPPHEPTKQSRQVVLVGRGMGSPVNVIAQQLGIDEKTLRKHYPVEMAQGMDTVRFRVGARAIQKALAGDNAMIMFYLRQHGGEAWKDRQRVEHTGADGTPLAPPTLIVSFLPPTPSSDEP